MYAHSPAWPHGPIRPAFPDVFYVVGTNRTHHAGVDIQTSRTMVIVREAGVLTLLNTVRLDEDGLRALEALGTIRHVIRLGAFHGRDDPFYCDRHGAALWALPGTTHADGRATDHILTADGPLPVQDASLFAFTSAQHPEAAVLLARAGGILITCDAVQNWAHVDEYFSPECGALFAAQGLIGVANIPATWRHACAPDVADFQRLLALPFRHLISAHGEPLRDEAHTRIATSVAAAFPA